MNQVKSLGMVLVNSNVIARELNDWAEVVEATEEFFKKNPDEAGGRVEFVSYVARLDNFDNHFEVEHNERRLWLDDLHYLSESGEGTYRIDDYSKEFDTEDEVKEFIEELFKKGEIDLDEVREMDVTFIPEEIEGNTFRMAEAEEASFSIELNSVSRSIADHFGFSFVLSDEANILIDEAGARIEPGAFEASVKEALDKELAKHDVLVMREPSLMDAEEIDVEMKLLQERMFNLQMEKRNRGI